MEENEIFNKESIKKYLIEKVNSLNDFDTLFTIYRFVRRILEDIGKN